ncbi:MAG: alpha/beta fold hydrolase [Pseudonocardiales bacterium]|nr:alpha/beta fold hydrolase [Pseudonocardiales bacterium]MBV9029398.1 alpha/beta fold hydrolase [Pseudonocardiales bacterium]MBW0009257.1 alpha/beta fold hydrolase [Pseudonocardiales bacterium]
MPRLLRSTAVLVIALVLSGCAAEAEGARQSADVAGSHSDAGVYRYQAGPAGRVPRGLERFYSQRLTWSGCADFAVTDRDRQSFADPDLRCTRVEVPLDYAHPDGRTARLGVLRRPADDQPARLGSVLVNPGGPGASGMGAVASLATAVAGTDLGRRFDLVGFDPRGVGASEPRIICRNTQEEDAERLDVDLDTSPAGIAQTESQNRAYAALCAERAGMDVLANAGTRDVARDMDVMRSALGDEKINYLGYSYGTRIGISYAEQFSGNVRAMVLDGVLGPNENLVESLVNQGAGFQQSFDAFVDWCLAQSHCWLGSTPKDQANHGFQQLLLPLTIAARPVGDRKLSYSDATIGTIQALYTDQLWPVLNRGLTELANGTGSTLLRLADIYYQRDEHGYSGSQDAFKAVRCVDDPPVTDPAVVWEADRLYRQAAPFLDDGHPPSAARDACAFWPVPPTGEPTEPQVEGLSPVLVVSTTGDPATPYQAGVELARRLRGKLVTFEGNRHTVVLQGVKCVDDAVSDYLVRLVLPKRATLCVV